jgi:CysZ protein
MKITIFSFVLPFQSMPVVFRDSKLLRYALIPWLINILLFAGAMTSFGFLDRWLMGKLAAILGTGWWVTMVAWTLGIVLFLAFGAGLVISFTFLANLIGGVFLEDLSRRTEQIFTGGELPPPAGNFMAVFTRSAVETLKGVGFFLLVWLGLLLLNFIPFIGTALFIALSAAWSALAMTFEFISPAAERRGLRFRKKCSLVFSNWAGCLAFGSAVLLLSFIPLLNLFFIPFAAVAGTQLYLQMEKQ